MYAHQHRTSWTVTHEQARQAAETEGKAGDGRGKKGRRLRPGLRTVLRSRRRRVQERGRARARLRRTTWSMQVLPERELYPGRHGTSLASSST